MPTTLGPRPRRAPGALAALVVALSVALTGCLSDTAPEETASGAPQEARRVWSVPATTAPLVETATDRFWTSSPFWFDDSKGEKVPPVLGGELAIYDSATGDRVPTSVDDFVCAQAHLDPGDDVAVLLTAPRGPEQMRADAWRTTSVWPNWGVPASCTGLVAVRLATGDVLWRRALADVEAVTRSSLELHDDALHVTTYEDWEATARCFALRDGSPIGCDASSPGALLDDLGEPMDSMIVVPEVLTADRGVSVILTRILSGEPQSVHVHDTRTGEWLWDAALERDPDPQEGAYRGQTYAFDDEGLLLFSYEGDDRSVLVASRVDERTGEVLGEVGRIDDAVFQAQSGATTIVGGLRRDGRVPPVKGYRFGG